MLERPQTTQDLSGLFVRYLTETSNLPAATELRSQCWSQQVSMGLSAYEDTNNFEWGNIGMMKDMSHLCLQVLLL